MPLLSYRPSDTVDFYEQIHNGPDKVPLENLRSWGVAMPEMRYLKKTPYIGYYDLTKGQNEQVDMNDFKDRILLPNWIDAGLDLHFIPETVRLSVVKWGPGKDQIGRITIAEENWMGGFSVISHVSVRIDKCVVFACGVVIMDCACNPVDPTRPAGFDNCYMAPVHIGESVWLGTSVIIMPGVTIGHHSMVGARSVVTKDVPPYSVAAGNPAKVIRTYQTE